jgi:hypothetical protein
MNGFPILANHDATDEQKLPCGDVKRDKRAGGAKEAVQFGQLRKDINQCSGRKHQDRFVDGRRQCKWKNQQEADKIDRQDVGIPAAHLHCHDTQRGLDRGRAINQRKAIKWHSGEDIIAIDRGKTFNHKPTAGDWRFIGIDPEVANEKASNQHKEFGIIQQHDPVVMKVPQPLDTVLEAKMGNQHPDQKMADHTVNKINSRTLGGQRLHASNLKIARPDHLESDRKPPGRPFQTNHNGHLPSYGWQF